MNKKWIIKLNAILLVVIVFLAIGCLPARLSNQGSLAVPSSSIDDEVTFQEYLWYENPVVLIIQIGLMLAGVLGVSALLPAPGEEGGS